MHKKTLLLTAILIASCYLLFGQPGNGNGNGNGNNGNGNGGGNQGSSTLVFSPTTIPDGQYGSSYKNLTLNVSGGKNPYSFSLTGGALPAGMALSGDGVLSGAPKAAGSFSFTVNATDHSKNPVSGAQQYNLVIDPAVAQVTANAATKNVGDPDPVFTYAVSGLVNGDNAGIFTGSLSRTPGESAGIYPITRGTINAGANYTIGYTGNFLTIVTGNTNQGNGNGGGNPDPSGTLVFSPATIPNGKYGSSYGNVTLKVTGGTAPYTFSISSGALPPGMALSSGGAFSGVPKAAGSYAVTVAVTDHSKTPMSASQDYTLVVDQAELTVTANNSTMTYGSAVPSLAVSYNGFVNGDNSSSLTTMPAITTGASSSSSPGAYSITVSGAADPNYHFTYISGNLTISPARLSVTANAVTKAFGAADPALTYSAGGFVNGEGVSVLTGKLSRNPGENVGSYPITQGSLAAGANYTIGFTGNYLTITKASQEITWAQSLLVGCQSTTQLQLNATASSGLPVTYSVSDASVATVSGNVLTLVNPGTAVVTATQAGNSDYPPAAAVTDTLVYQPASLISQHWSDVLFFDNSSGDFTGWQWYKNGQAVPGATDPYYSDTPTLNGQYYVIAINKDGQQIQSCTLSVTGGAAIAGGIKVFPNPANAGGLVTVNSNYSNPALKGAVLQLVDVSGKIRQQLTVVKSSSQLTMPSDAGIYIVNLLLAGGQKASTNVLVIN